MTSRTGSAVPPRRGRGRPVGGGNTAEQARERLLEAAERLFIRHGFAAVTMEAIAREAGYSRAVVYRHFRNRDELTDALAVRAARAQLSGMAGRLLDCSDLGETITEALAIMAIEVGQDPLLRILAERDGDGSVANLIVHAPRLSDLLMSLLAGTVGSRPGDMRPGLRSQDAARYLLFVALGLLLGLIPGADDADQVKRYVKTFVLPALLKNPPAPEPVFGPVEAT